jgi:hypothetical protein
VVTATELREALTALGLSQTAFANLTGSSRVSVCVACSPHTQRRVPINLAIALRHLQLIADVKDALSANADRVGRKRLRAAIKRAEQPVCPPQRRKYGARRPKLPPAPVQAPPIPTFPPSPPNHYWAWEGYNLVLRRHRPQHDGII